MGLLPAYVSVQRCVCARVRACARVCMNVCACMPVHAYTKFFGIRLVSYLAPYMNPDFECRCGDAAADDNRLGRAGLSGSRLPSRHRGHPAHPVPVSGFLRSRHCDYTPEAGIH